MDVQLQLIENFTKLMRNGMANARDAHNYIFDDSVKDEIALTSLSFAVAKFSAAEALYYSKIESLESTEAEKIFSLFNAFKRELFTNFRTHHSHQETDSKYLALWNAFRNSIFSFDNEQL